jgi:hypothetical protein
MQSACPGPACENRQAYRRRACPSIKVTLDPRSSAPRRSHPPTHRLSDRVPSQPQQLLSRHSNFSPDLCRFLPPSTRTPRRHDNHRPHRQIPRRLPTRRMNQLPLPTPLYKAWKAEAGSHQNTCPLLHRKAWRRSQLAAGLTFCRRQRRKDTPLRQCFLQYGFRALAPKWCLERSGRRTSRPAEMSPGRLSVDGYLGGRGAA